MAVDLSAHARSHDSFCNALLASPERAGSVLRAQLEPWMSSLLADSLPEALDGSFVDEELRASRSDKLFRVRLKSGQPGFAHVLLEHLCIAPHKTPYVGHKVM